MQFSFTRNTMTIKSVYDSFTEGRLIIDNTYQRRKVWLPKDNIRLIETILLNLIIPEIFFWVSDTDPDTGDTITHIVDGQQRINAIVDFITGEYKLQSKFLLSKEVKNIYGDKKFNELPSEIKKQMWSYNLSIVNIDRNCTVDDIKGMFYRLNLTDYSLNEQEKRNSLDSAFGNASKELADNKFWEDHKVFSNTDIRRMRDIEFCGDILILAREGIVDQTNDKKINQVYDDLKENYVEKENDFKLVFEAMNLIERFSNEDTTSFISKKTQLYTLFCIAFSLLEKEIPVDDEMIFNLKVFVVVYNKFKNNLDLSFENENLEKMYENIRKYKLASSEGVNKISNRVIRYEILSKICTIKNQSTKVSLEAILQQIDTIEN